MSRRAAENKEHAKRNANNLVEFLQSEGYIQLKADSTITSRDLYAMPEQIMEDQIVEVITQPEEDYGALIPEHALLRFARFLLPKIQADLEKKEE